MRILTYPNDKDLLLRPGRDVTEADINSPEFSSNLERMKQLLKEDGIGLAATQVGWGLNLFLISVDEQLKPSAVRVCLNPRITSYSSDKELDIEGCLSFPYLSLKIKRPSVIEWNYTDLNGNLHAQKSHGYYARAIQHEIDHLGGKLFISRASSVQKLKISKWLKARNPRILIRGGSQC